MVDGRPLPNRFPFWGSPSLRPGRQGADVPADLRSLPLLGKPFIEARTTRRSARWARRIASPSGEALH